MVFKFIIFRSHLLRLCRPSHPPRSVLSAYVSQHRQTDGQTENSTKSCFTLNKDAQRGGRGAAAECTSRDVTSRRAAEQKLSLPSVSAALGAARPSVHMITQPNLTFYKCVRPPPNTLPLFNSTPQLSRADQMLVYNPPQLLRAHASEQAPLSCTFDLCPPPT